MGKIKKGWLLLAIYLATFMTAIESTIVVTAANAISLSFNGNVSISLLFSSYLFSSALSTPVMSRLADQYGKKRIFLFGLSLFVLGTFLCGMSHSFSLLVLFRILQGIGAGGIMPITFALIGELFAYSSRGKIMGLNNSAWGIASLIAPLLGGLLVDRFSWHWVFFINIPFGLLTIMIILFFYTEEKENVSSQFSVEELVQYSILILGLFALLAGIQLLAVNFIAGGIWFSIGLVILFFFMLSEKKKEEPVLPVDTFRIPGFLLFNIVTFLINGVLMGFQVYVTLWIQTQLHLSPTLAGLVLVPSSIFFITGSFLSAKLGKAIGNRSLLLICMSILFAVFVVLGLLTQDTPYVVFLGLAGFSGFGVGTAVTTSVLSAQAFATEKNISTVSGFITLCRTLGQSFMITVFGLVFTFFTKENLLTSGYHSVYFTAAILVVLSGILVFHHKKKRL